MTDEDTVGYPYRDVIQEPNVNSLSQVSADPQIEFEEVKIDAKVSFDFRDMKYLSNKKTFSTDLEISQKG